MDYRNIFSAKSSVDTVYPSRKKSWITSELPYHSCQGWWSVDNISPVLGCIELWWCRAQSSEGFESEYEEFQKAQGGRWRCGWVIRWSTSSKFHCFSYCEGAQQWGGGEIGAQQWIGDDWKLTIFFTGNWWLFEFTHQCSPFSCSPAGSYNIRDRKIWYLLLRETETRSTEGIVML